MATRFVGGSTQRPRGSYKKELRTMSTLFVSKRLSIAPSARLSGEWQDISAWESGLVKAKLELLEKEFDGLLGSLDKATGDITQRSPNPPWPPPRH